MRPEACAASPIAASRVEALVCRRAAVAVDRRADPPFRVYDGVRCHRHTANCPRWLCRGVPGMLALSATEPVSSIAAFSGFTASGGAAEIQKSHGTERSLPPGWPPTMSCRETVAQESREPPA
jgi:hypothetical protein